MARNAASAIQSTGTASPATARTLAIASGKGGVGKSHIALNLSLVLAELGQSVCLLDASENSGQFQVLCGAVGYWNLSHVIAGTKTVEEVALNGPGGIRMLDAAGGLLCPDATEQATQQPARRQLARFLEQFDLIIIDTPTGKHSVTQRIMSMADAAWLVTIPEFTAIAETYSLMKTCRQMGPLPDWEILVNLAESPNQARDILNQIRKTTQSFLHCDIFPAGHIPYDRTVPQAVGQRLPFCRAAPSSDASNAIRQLARHWSDRCRRIPGKSLPEFQDVNLG